MRPGFRTAGHRLFATFRLDLMRIVSTDDLIKGSFKSSRHTARADDHATLLRECLSINHVPRPEPNKRGLRPTSPCPHRFASDQKHLGFPVAHHRARHFHLRQLVPNLKQDLHRFESTSAVVPSDNLGSSDLFVQSWLKSGRLQTRCCG